MHIPNLTGLHIYQGELWELEVSNFEGEDAPDSLAGYTAFMDFNSSVSQPALRLRGAEDGSVTEGIEITAEPPRLVIALTPEQTRGLQPRTHYGTDLWLVEPDGTPRPLFRAVVTVTARETRHETHPEPEE